MLMQEDKIYLEEDSKGRLVHKNTDNWLGKLSNKYLGTDRFSRKEGL